MARGQRAELGRLFPERTRPACEGVGSAGVVAPHDPAPSGSASRVDCSRCGGGGYVVGGFGPAPATR